MSSRFRFHHVALSVSDSGLATAFYHRFGFETVLEWQSEDGDLTITQLQLGGVMLELFCFAANHGRMPSAEPLLDNLQQLGPRHFALQVDHLEQTLAELKAADLVPSETTISEGRTGIRYFFIRDPDGNFVEIAEDKRF